MSGSGLGLSPVNSAQTQRVSRGFWYSPLLSAVVAALIAGAFSYMNGRAQNYTDLARDVITLQANRVNDAQNIDRIEKNEERIEAKLDQVLEKLAK